MGNTHTFLTAVEIKQYCDDHIDKLNVEPIVKEAYRHNLLSTQTTYIYLRLAEQKEQKEKGIKPYITQEMIANELNIYQSKISLFCSDENIKIPDKTFVKLGIIRNWNKMLNILETDDYTVQLADFINKYTQQRLLNEIISKRETYIMENKEFSPDVCRKIFKELLNEKISYKTFSTDKEINENDITFNISSLTFLKGKYSYSLITYYDYDNVIEENITCLKGELVHNIVQNIHRRIGGHQRLGTHTSQEKDSPQKQPTENKTITRDIYLSTDSKHRKIQRAFQYLAFDKPNFHINI